ncbi:hypothetical protein D3C80_1439700 [compost metagenome]
MTLLHMRYGHRMCGRIKRCRDHLPCTAISSFDTNPFLQTRYTFLPEYDEYDMNPEEARTEQRPALHFVRGHTSFQFPLRIEDVPRQAIRVSLEHRPD